MVDIQNLEGRLQSLEARSVTCVRLLRETADALRERKHGPSRRALDELDRLCEQYDTVCGEILPDRMANADRPSLPELKQASVQQQTRHSAAGLLDRVLSISRVDGQSFSPLEQCHSEAQRLRLELLTSHGVRTQELAQSLLVGRHPMSALLELVTLGDILSDEQWTRQHECVQAAFGKDLGVAVARHKLTCGSAVIEASEETLAANRTNDSPPNNL